MFGWEFNVGHHWFSHKNCASIMVFHYNDFLPTVMFMNTCITNMNACVTKIIAPDKMITEARTYFCSKRFQWRFRFVLKLTKYTLQKLSYIITSIITFTLKALITTAADDILKYFFFFFFFLIFRENKAWHFM